MWIAHARQSRWRRRGSVHAAAVGVVALGGAFVGVAVWVMPGSLIASPSARPADIILPEAPANARAMDALRVLLEQSESLVAVHTPGDDGRLRAVVWYQDLDGDGMTAVGELVVLVHHPTTRTLAACSFDDELSATSGLSEERLSYGLVTSRRFAERWALRTDVRSRVIVTGLTNMSLEPARSGGGAPGWRVSLTWAGDPADASGGEAPRPDVGSVLVDLPTLTGAGSATE